MIALSVGLVCVTVLVLWWRVEPLIVRALEARASQRASTEKAITYYATRVFDLLEQRRTPREPEPVATSIPSDLLLVAMSESEEWAQLDTEKEMRQLYAQATGSPEERWNRVRRAYELTETTS